MLFLTKWFKVIVNVLYELTCVIQQIQLITTNVPTYIYTLTIKVFLYFTQLDLYLKFKYYNFFVTSFNFQKFERLSISTMFKSLKHVKFMIFIHGIL